MSFPTNAQVFRALTRHPSWWPDCNWCSKGTNHLANPSTDSGDDGDDDDSDDSDDSNTGADPYADSGDDDDDSNLRRRNPAAPHGHATTFSAPAKRQIFGTHHHRLRKWKNAVAGEGADKVEDIAVRQDPVPDGVLPSVTLPTNSLLPTTQTTSSVGTMMGTPAPAEAPAKTQATTKSASCTPSPTKSLAPSASTSRPSACPYQRK